MDVKLDAFKQASHALRQVDCADMVRSGVSSLRIKKVVADSTLLDQFKSQPVDD